MAKLAAEDGISFRQIATSVTIQKGLHALGFKDIPKSVNGVVLNISRFFQVLIESHKKDIQKSKQTMKFSLVFDEWVSNASKRYLNAVLLGSDNFWNLGLVRIFGSATSDNILNLIKTHLMKYDLDFDHNIACIITDGCSVMTCIGDLIKQSVVPVQQQLCFAHAVQLAVVEVIYSGGFREEAVNESNLDDEDDYLEDDWISFDDENPEPLLNEQFFSMIQNVRSTIRIFRKAPLKNETLQKYVKSELGKELMLILDCKTRWNSLCDMLERFLKLKDCIMIALNILKIKPLLNDDDFDHLEKLVAALKPVKAIVEVLCRRDANLIKADAALNALLEHLQSQETDISRRLYFSLITKLKERRTIVSDVLKYLHSGSTQSPIHSHLSTRPLSINRISKLIRFTINQGSNNNRDDQVPRDDLLDFLEEEEENEKSPSKKRKEDEDFRDFLNKAVDSSMEPKFSNANQSESSVSAELTTELDLFATSNGSQRGKHLEFAFKSLLAISPTSVESERAFSSASYLCNKFRSKLSDENICTLVSLRSHFKSLNKK